MLENTFNNNHYDNDEQDSQNQQSDNRTNNQNNGKTDYKKYIGFEGEDTLSINDNKIKTKIF